MLPSLNGKIIISKNLSKPLLDIVNTLSENAKRNSVNELGFFMFGYELENGDVVINKILSYFEEYNNAVRLGKVNYAFDEQNTEEFKQIWTDLNDFIKHSNYARPVFFQGHTHPDLTPIFGINSPFSSGTNASWCDIRGLIETTNDVTEISSRFGKIVQFANIIINSAIDFDVISYQNFGNGFKLYKHPNIYLGEEKLPSFSKHKYLIDDELRKKL